MRKRLKRCLAAAALLAACTGNQRTAGPPAGSSDPEEGWLDTARVEVVTDGCAGVETVSLVDEAGGHELVVTEQLAAGEVACSPDAGAPSMVAAVSTH
jgi:hypothetical protein